MTGERGSRSSSSSSNVGLRVGVLGRRDDLDLLVELVGEDRDDVVGQRLRERRHLAEAHQLLDDLRHADAERLGDVLDGRPGVDADDVRLQRGDVLRDGLFVGAATAPAAATARRAIRGTATGAATGTAGTATGTLPARGLRVDDDAADAAGRTRERARPAARSAWAAGNQVAAGAVAAGLRLGLRLGLGLGRGLGGEVLRARGAGGAVTEAGALLKHRRSRLLRGAVARDRLGLGLAGQRGVGELLVHGGCGGLHLEAGSVKPLDDLRGRHVVLLG